MCDICGRTPCATRCPNYVAENPCELCGGNIEDGDKFAVIDGKLVHYDCIAEHLDDVLDMLEVETGHFETYEG